MKKMTHRCVDEFPLVASTTLGRCQGLPVSKADYQQEGLDCFVF
jgi:hypothetical protein